MAEKFERDVTPITSVLRAARRDDLRAVLGPEADSNPLPKQPIKSSADYRYPLIVVAKCTRQLADGDITRRSEAQPLVPPRRLRSPDFFKFQSALQWAVDHDGIHRTVALEGPSRRRSLLNKTATGTVGNTPSSRRIYGTHFTRPCVR